jgi:two-component system response regulator AtoC
MNDRRVEKPSCDQIINILPDPFVVIDRNYHVIAANNSYLKRYGFSSREEVTGRYCYEISHHSDAPCSKHGEHCPLETIFKTGQATQVMHVHYDQNDREEYVQLQSTPLFDTEGRVIYVGEYIFPVNQPNDDALVVGRSRPILRMNSLLQRVAPTQTTVLLLGESGVGKECVAKYLHQFSHRSNLPFVIVDCGTLGESLIESELFGHEKGSFTGATVRKKGLFEAAHGGTLFIDEIAELPLPLQTKLLRALETGTIRRLGGTDYIRVDVRVVAATNRDLRGMVERGEFRQDLYYRLSAFPVKIPPLRDRRDDIPALAEHFLARTEEGDRHVPLSVQVIETLMSYDYPGNVRELRNIIERAAILAGDEVITPDHIVLDDNEEQPAVQVQRASTFSGVSEQRRLLNRRTGRLSDEEILQALEKCSGHRSRTAEELGISERTLYRHVKRLRSKYPESCTELV